MTTLLRPAQAYYADAEVQQRIREYCGASQCSGLSCAFISELSPGGHVLWDTAPRYLADMLPVLFEHGWDLSRSLADRSALIVHVELDYADANDPASALVDPARAFGQMEPVYVALSDELRRLALPLLDVMTGRGYHFSGRVPLVSPLVSRVAEIAPAGYARTQRAHTGLGMLMEYLATNVLDTARRTSALPVVVNGVEVGQGGEGRQAISIDLSEYGDPLSERQLRVAFGTYQSQALRPDIFGAAAALPAIAAVPRRGRALRWMLDYARSLDQARGLARGERAMMPTVSSGVDNLLAEYSASRVAELHRAYYATTPCGPDLWPDTFDQFDASSFPGCVREPLERANDALLKPTVLQHLTRVLLARGWNARDIASLVWSKYARPADWGTRWQRIDPQLRAEFDVRVFSTLVATGTDRLVDFNCVSAQENHLCPRSECAHDLRADRDRLRQGLAA